ncbi:hypothetical protein E2562_023727 [Oryza meyeriana var. granulata]|uniref:Uncharacterized protein n=1 Tax=Oryza meyeriana var. granulata TaxID=110450 RepID=A0A6G1DM97_9ORYZ|nr:hypothetical protein E2562_023727 [Oryza meyeriana var. granulata]
MYPIRARLRINASRVHREVEDVHFYIGLMLKIGMMARVVSSGLRYNCFCYATLMCPFLGKMILTEE